MWYRVYFIPTVDRLAGKGNISHILGKPADIFDIAVANLQIKKGGKS